MAVWRDKSGRPNPKGHHQLIDGKLVNVRSKKLIRDNRGRFAPNIKTKWRDRFGRPNPRGHYRVVDGKLVNIRSKNARRNRFGRFDTTGRLIARKKRLIIRHPRPGAPTEPPRDVAPEAPEDAAPEAPEPAAPPPVERIPPPVGDQFRPPGRFFTYFSAMGTMGALSEIGGPNGSPPILFEDDPDFPAPLAWYSRQSSILGQVRWEGVIDLQSLIARLNTALQFFGEEVRGFDFRREYAAWSYRYQVVRVRGPDRAIIDEVERAG